MSIEHITVIAITLQRHTTNGNVNTHVDIKMYNVNKYGSAVTIVLTYLLSDSSLIYTVPEHWLLILDTIIYVIAN